MYVDVYMHTCIHIYIYIYIYVCMPRPQQAAAEII